jgi:hypothetical protein
VQLAQHLGVGEHVHLDRGLRHGHVLDDDRAGDAGRAGGVGVRPLAAVRGRGGADDAERLADERALTVGPRQPVDRVVEDGRHGAVVLRRHGEHPVGTGHALAQRRGGLRDLTGVEVLVVERQLGETVDEVEGHAVGRLVAQQLGQLAVDGVGAEAADEDGDTGGGHWFSCGVGKETVTDQTDCSPVLFRAR